MADSGVVGVSRDIRAFRWCGRDRAWIDSSISSQAEAHHFRKHNRTEENKPYDLEGWHTLWTSPSVSHHGESFWRRKELSFGARTGRQGSPCA